MSAIDGDALLKWVNERATHDRTTSVPAAWERLAREIQSGRFDMQEGVTLTEAERLLVIRALVDWHGGSDGEFHARRNLAASLEAVAA